MPSMLRHQFIPFLLAGGMSTLFSYLMYAALLYLGLPYVAASRGSLLLRILFSRRTQCRFVFGNAAGLLFIGFAASRGLLLLLTITIIWSLAWPRLNAYWAGAVAMASVIALSELVQRPWVFGAPQARQGVNS